MDFELKHNYHIAVPTAFDEKEEVNSSATIEHILYLQEQGIHSVLMCGTTGEQHSMTLQEKMSLLEAVEKENRWHRDFEILFGVASIRQKEAVELTKYINDLQTVSGILLGFPPYVLPNQAELKGYIESILQVTEKPVILYNNPRRIGVDADAELLNEVFRHSNVIGIKEAGEPQKILQFDVSQKQPFYIYAGGEADLAEKVALGYHRLSSVGGNLYPNEIKEWFDRLLAGATEEFEFAKGLAEKLADSPIDRLKMEITKKEQIDMGRARQPLGNQ